MFITVFSQVCVLIILIAVGFFTGKTKLFNENGAKVCSNIVMYIVTPCVIIKSLMMKFDPVVLRAMAVSFALSLLLFTVTILASHILIRSPNSDRGIVLRFGAVFSNCGFMGLPLQQALLGEEGVLYGSVYIVLFNILLWSYGVLLMSGDFGAVSVKKLIVNPGLVSLCIGLAVFLFSLPVPTAVSESIRHLAALNTPLPMLIIGFHLSQSNLWNAIRDVRCMLAILLRMVVYPFACLGLLFAMGIRGVLLVSLVISVSAPVAAITTIFSVKFSRETELSVNMVSASTVISMISMPLVITVAQLLA